MSAIAIPKIMKAVVMQEGYTVASIDQPVPAIGDDDILVKTVAVAQNPTDWRHAAHLGKPGMVIGLDWSGRVVQSGKHVSAPVVGQHVAGFVAGGTHAGSGAFAEYVKTPADLVWEVPEDTLSDEEASTLGCAFWTAVQGLYAPGRLGLVEPPAKVEGERWVLIYGGGSSVGQFAIQLAHISGYKVVTTASPRNFGLLTSLGADAVFDYNDPEVVSKIKAATGDTIIKAFDAISTKGSQIISVRAIAPAGGKVVLVLSPISEAKVRDALCSAACDDMPVADMLIARAVTMVYTALGHAVDFGPEMRWSISPEDRAHMVAFLKKVPKLVAEEKLKPNPVKLWEGGLAAVPEGLQYAREGKVRAEKIVYRV